MKKTNRAILIFLILSLCFNLTACSNETGSLKDDEERLLSVKNLTDEELLNSLSLRQKAAQMVQAERAAITPQQAVDYGVGSILSGGGSSPTPNTPSAWVAMYNEYQSKILSEDQIPVIYGIDAVHGHNAVYGATVFPHNIGLGATRNPGLMYEIGKAVSEEVRLTGLNWTFAPAVSVVQDIRWGRTYESFGESAEIQKLLVNPYVRGIQEMGVAATAKHFIADGGTSWDDNSKTHKIDQGNAILTEEELREIHLPGYLEAIEADVDSIMVSFSSINGEKLHGSQDMITDFLKGQLGFEGIVVSDYQALHQLPGTFEQQVITCVNAGVDMLMEPHNWKETINVIVNAVENGDISMDRVNDAVARILKVKRKYNLLDNPISDQNTQDLSSEAHKELARRAVRESLVLLKNENQILPLKKDSNILLIGPAIDNVGYQCGGWTITWEGSPEKSLVPGVSIKEAFEKIAENNGGRIITDYADAAQADCVVLVIGEEPYAEFNGDNGQLDLYSHTSMYGNREAIEQAKETGLPIITIMIAGRPMVITQEISGWDGFVMAWLPGSEGGLGIADCVYGDYSFTGKLPVTWPKDQSQFGYNINSPDYDPAKVLFPYGFGM
ncbi:MAG: glycoside hydrolase family 3 protein [Acetivibrionales bacterium]|nr:glycoside hydrolase family 3 protein [Clostridiaceae bacterium]